MYDQTDHDAHLRELAHETTTLNIHSEEFATAAKNLRLFAEVRTILPEPEIDPTPVPVTKWGRFKAATEKVWDNETTRVFIKAAGAFGGVGLVVYSQVHRDHVLDKTAMQQANHSNS